MKKNTDSQLRRLAIVLKDSNDAITVQNLAGQFLAWNKGAEKMYGYTEDEALNMNVKDIVPANNQEETVSYLSSIAKGKIVESFETVRVNKKGKELNVWLIITCMKNNEDVIDSIATTERDITPFKNEINRLKELLPICASCKNIRDDKGYWHKIESYINEHSGTEFSHGICPDCTKELYPDYHNRAKNKK